MNCGDCILLRAALRNRRSRLLFANYIRAFRAFPRSKNLTAVYAYRKAQETQFYGKLSPETSNHFSVMFFRKTRKMSDGVLSVLRAKFDAVFGKLSPNLKSFFGDVFSQDKASKPPLYMHTARRKKRSFTGISARTSAHFSVMFFRKTRKISADVQAFFKRNLTPYSGNSARTSNHFSVMFFRKTRKMSADVQAFFKRNLTQYSEKPARTSNHFSAMFFRKTRKMSADVQAYFKRNLTQYCGKTARKIRFP